ncbi:MAG: porin [Terricaulis sp.]
MARSLQAIIVAARDMMMLKTAALAGASWLAVMGAASAQEAIQTQHPAAPADPRDARITALEQELADIEAQLADLKASAAADTAEIRRVQAAAPATTIANGRPTFALTGDPNQKIALRAIAQFDVSQYVQDDPRTPDNRRADTNAASDLNSGSNFRRARVGIDGSYGDWNYALWGDFGGSGTETPVLNQAFIEYAGFKPWDDVSLRFRVGAWATPTSLEDATATADLPFVERPAVAELVRGIAGGDGRSGVGAFGNGGNWYASGVLTGATVGNTGEFDEQSGYLARIAFRPLHSETLDVHVGANVAGVIDPADTNAGAVTTQVLRLRERPELRTDATRFVDTGSIPSGGVTAYGAELGASLGSFYAAAEAFQIDLDRTGGLSDPHFSGWYVQGAWTFTGERRTWLPASGGFSGIRPAAIFDPKTGHWGAWEITARYSDLDLNFHEGALNSAAIAGDTVRGGEQQITTVGLNWYPNNVVRFILDYQWASIDRLDPENGIVANTTIFGGSPSVAGNGAQIGQDFQAVTLRSQFAF